ncbi:hypothetical protein DEJ23_13335 [Curtobacterium sp. MCSS17_008]|uniref:DUF6766 family protein n=1 Tax=Curtobacterium sp. MCSS17_008 TaxID=2175647 RepID=UPI000DA788BE|nr:DUF6766 family protein [Curtobacterium sp. MCSS17_008]PZF54118.1 hypothetical protein DEJ23_13335 [Curtobacterium sp. MCSS17_008]
MRHFVRQNSLSLFFGALFLLALVGQSFAGWYAFNDTQTAEGLATIGYGEYVTSSSFATDVAENWQSEYLQFLLYIWATVWFVQRGSPESKEPSGVGRESDHDQEVGAAARPGSPRSAAAVGLRQTLFSHSLLIVMGTVFVLSWLAQSVAGTVAFNEEQLASLEPPVTWIGYVTSADFWNRTLQNWQSEFLAVGSMVVLSVFLRERGSPESKPVGARDDDTGAEG